MRKMFFGLVCTLAACGDNWNSDAVIDASQSADAGADAATPDAPLQVQVLTPSPYLRREDSPFKNLATWHVEDFEDHLLDDVPGTTDNNGHNTLSVSVDVDSVDNDDGQLDDTCANCDSWHISGGPLRFTFSNAGGLPTHAGLVWTDAAAGGLTVTFEAFDGQGTSLGTVSLPNHSDAQNTGTTAEDRFFGVIAPGGVGSIQIQNSSGGIEIDHLQWGR